MTQQIVIKLNKKKFEPILKDIKKVEGFNSKTYSEEVSKIIVALDIIINKKIKALCDSTPAEFLKQAISNGVGKDLSLNEISLLFLNEHKKRTKKK